MGQPKHLKAANELHRQAAVGQARIQSAANAELVGHRPVWTARIADANRVAHNQDAIRFRSNERSDDRKQESANRTEGFHGVT